MHRHPKKILVIVKPQKYPEYCHRLEGISDHPSQGKSKNMDGKNKNRRGDGIDYQLKGNNYTIENRFPRKSNGTLS